MSDLGDRIRYLRDCYRADTRGGGVYNLLDRKLEHCTFLTPDDRLLSSLGGRLPVGEKFAAAAAAASLYRREKSLLYMAFPIVGRPAEKGRLPAVLCAPLLLYPARLEAREKHSETFDLSIDREDVRLNFPAISALLESDTAIDERLEVLSDKVPAPPLAWEDLFDLVRLLEQMVPSLDAQGLHAFPKLHDRRQVESAVRSVRGQRKHPDRKLCLPACALALVPNSVETRGTLYELDQLAGTTVHSPPLRTLLGEPAAASPPAHITRVPAVLSRAQNRILSAAAEYPLSLVIGPPGTGKSFTLAALALEHVARGRSVLIAARGNQALAVIEKKIEDLLEAPSFVLRAGRRSQLKELKDSLRHLLRGGSPLRGAAPREARRLAALLMQHDYRLQELLSQLRKRDDLEQRWGEGELPVSGLLRSWFRSVSRRRVRRQLDRLPDLWQLLEHYQRELDEGRRMIAELLRATIRERIEHTRRLHRAELSRFLGGLRARQSARQIEFFKTINHQVLLQTFPLWTVTFAGAHQSIPRVSGLFDLVLIDEATQCDLATCLPIIDRGRRLVVTGDPRQLRHVSFLSRAQQRLFADRYGLQESDREELDYRGRSLLDRAEDVIWAERQTTLLDEHYRSAPQIIAFSNREFYRDEIRVMTRRPETARRQSIELRRTDGSRDASGVNAGEARALVDELVAWVERERELPPATCHSLGVLSPFRDQVDFLVREIHDRLELAAIEKHDLLVGTAYAFQGEERDVMFLSLAVDAAAHAGSFRFLDRPDVFNVSITRARSHQLVFCSLDPGCMAAPLVRKYLEEIGQPPAAAPGPDPSADPFLGEVGSVLRDRGYRVWPAYEIAGEVVDLVVERDGRTLGIDLVGYPGPYAESFDLERCRMLQRAGLAVFPLPYSAWKADPATCLTALDRFWGGGPSPRFR
jgi:AAA domain